ncbi:MAG: MliC family protein [Bauldia sp.]
MQFAKPLIAACGIALAASTASAQPAGQGIFIPTDEAPTNITAHYTCPFGAVTVDYMTAGAFSVALVHLPDETVLMAQVISADGGRYAGGPYIWWDHGNEATYFDTPDPADNDAGVTCTAAAAP